MGINEKKKLKMVIVCAEADAGRIFEEGFENAGFLSLGRVGSAQEAICLVEDQNPDLLLMEPFLPGMNCDELTAVLERRASAGLVKMVISDSKQDILASRFLAEGGDLFRILPIDYRFTADQVVEHWERRQRGFICSAEDPDHLIKDQLGDLLYFFGMRRSLNGFRYILDGALLGMRDHSLLRDMKNLLYPLLAAKERTSIECIEKCIRHAIDSLFRDGDPELLYRHFHPREDNGKVGNKEFISDLIAIYRAGALDQAWSKEAKY